MPCEYRIEADREHVHMVMTGTASMPELIAAVQGAAADSRFRPHFTVLCDLRRINYRGEIADADALTEVLRHKTTPFQGRFAVVVPEPLQLIARLYCVMVNMAGVKNVRSFADLDQAEKWCKAT